MNCLTEAIGLALPGNGSTLATHTARQGAVRGRRARGRRDRPALLRGATTSRCCRAPSPPGTRSRTRWRWTWRWAARPTRSCTCWPPPTRPGRLRARGHRRALAPGAVPVQGRAQRRALPRRGRAPRRRHPGHPRRAGPRRPAEPGACTPCTAPRSREWLDDWDLRRRRSPSEAVELFHAAPGGVRTIKPFSQEARWETLDDGPAEGCIRDLAHAYTRDGGLAVLYGNLAPEGAS